MKKTTRHWPVAAITGILYTISVPPAVAYAEPVAAVVTALPSYSDDVCKPPTVHPSDPLPPCVNIENVETLCYPNGTAPLYLAAHAQCMCHGSFFAEWNACRRCLSLHGQLADRELAYFQSVATAASTSLCGFLTAGGSVTTTPTAIFRDLFTSAQAKLPPPATTTAAAAAGGDAPESSTAQGPDQAPGNTDVDVYFTASGPLGPGPITGSATAATATALALATGHPPLPLSSASRSPGPSSSASAAPPSAAPSSPSQSGAAKSSASWMGATLAVVTLAIFVGGLLV